MGPEDAAGAAEPSAIQSYEDLRVWQAGIALAEAIYRVTVTFPESERFGLTSQLRRATVSIASNVAEGYGRGSRSDYLRFLRIARGSLFEVQTQLLIAQRIGFMTDDTAEQMRGQTAALRRQLLALIGSVERSLPV